MSEAQAAATLVGVFLQIFVNLLLAGMIVRNAYVISVVETRVKELEGT